MRRFLAWVVLAAICGWASVLAGVPADASPRWTEVTIRPTEDIPLKVDLAQARDDAELTLATGRAPQPPGQAEFSVLSESLRAQFPGTFIASSWEPRNDTVGWVAVTPTDPTQFVQAIQKSGLTIALRQVAAPSEVERDRSAEAVFRALLAEPALENPVVSSDSRHLIVCLANLSQAHPRA